jgi:hypothetical protein
MNNTKSIADIAKVMTEVYAKALRAEEQSRYLMEKSLANMSMSQFLLTEGEEDDAALSQSDVDALKTSVEKLKATMGNLAKALDLAGGKFSKTKASVEALAGEIPDPGTLAGMIIDPDPKAMAAETERINTGISNAGSAAASIIEGIKVFADNLKDAVADVPEDLKTGKTLEELGEMGKEGKLKTEDGQEIKFPDVAKLKSGAQKAVKVPNWFQQAFQSGMDSAKEEAGSFLGKVGSFFKGLFGKKQAGIDPSAFADEIVQTTLQELSSVAEGTAAVQEEMTSGVEAAAGAAAGAQAGSEAAEAEETDEGTEEGEVADPKKAQKRPEFDLFAYIKEKHPNVYKRIQAAGLEPTAGPAAEIDAEVEGGDVSPEAAVTDLEGELEDAGPPESLSWEEISASIASAVEDKASAEQVLSILGGSEDFKKALEDKVAFKEMEKAAESRTRRQKPMYKEKLGTLLFETIGFEDFASAGGVDKLGDDVNKEKVAADIATALNKEVGEDVVTDIPEVEEAAPDEPAPASEEEAAEEQDEAQSELEGAVQDAAGGDDPPGVAIMAALDGWVGGLSPTSQQSLQAKDRIGGLKANIQTALDGAAETLAKAISSAIGTWRAEHEETLTKSRRFAKKNFDALEKLIPQLAQMLLKKTNESGDRLTQGRIKRFVHSFLDRKFKDREKPLISESFIPANDLINSRVDEDYGYTEDELVHSRWMRMAGLEEKSNDQ